MTKTSTTTTSTGPTTAEVRAWAIANGLTASTHGRLSASVREQYDAAHGKS